MFALQDEPEKGRRWAILGVGAVLAIGLQGGGLYGAYQYAPPPKPRRVAVKVKMVTPPSEAPPTAPPSEAPKTAPPTAPPTAAPKTKPPKKKKPKPKKKPPKKKPPPEKPKPEQPKSAAPKTAPIKLNGLTYDSTSPKGKGPAVQQGNNFGGYDQGKAKDGVKDPPPPAPTTEPPPPVIVKAKLKKKVKPKYTRAALRADIQGKVIVFATIGADGTVKAVKLIKGLGYGLDEAAVEAVKKWIYSPQTVDGRPVQVRKRIKVEFVIEE